MNIERDWEKDAVWIKCEYFIRNQEYTREWKRGIMTRTEFIDILQRTLAGSLGSSYVNENVRYYQEYIDTQIRSGYSEEDAVAQLGDPRLIAKSIIEAAKQENSAYANAQEYDEIFEDGSQAAGEERNPKVYRMPGWLLVAAVVLIVIAAVAVVGSLLSALLPIIIPFVCVMFVIRFFKNQGGK